MVGGLEVAEKKTGAAKVITSTGTVWCHFSQQDAVIKLRRFSEGTIFELNTDGVEIEEFVPLALCKKLVPAERYNLDNVEVWTTILQKLEAGVAPVNKDSAGATQSSPVIVPITYLRQFYETLNLLETATWVNFAQFYSTAPTSLERLWRLSREAFLAYHNEDGWGRQTTKDLPAASNSVKDISSTNQFTEFIRQDDNSFSTDTGYTFVEREINPRRTTSGFYSNKQPATSSGAGGIDVLLKSHETGFPTVGEVKVGKDKNAFFALIQAMTYAVELSTPSQRARLKKHFAGQFGDLDVLTGKVEIALLMVNPVKDETRGPVLNLIKTLNARKKCEGLGKIVMIENDGGKWNCYS